LILNAQSVKFVSFRFSFADNSNRQLSEAGVAPSLLSVIMTHLKLAPILKQACLALSNVFLQRE